MSQCGCASLGETGAQIQRKGAAFIAESVGMFPQELGTHSQAIYNRQRRMLCTTANRKPVELKEWSVQQRSLHKIEEAIGHEFRVDFCCKLYFFSSLIFRNVFVVRSYLQLHKIYASEMRLLLLCLQKTNIRVY